MIFTGKDRVSHTKWAECMNLADFHHFNGYCKLSANSLEYLSKCLEQLAESLGCLVKSLGVQPSPWMACWLILGTWVRHSVYTMELLIYNAFGLLLFSVVSDSVYTIDQYHKLCLTDKSKCRQRSVETIISCTETKEENIATVVRLTCQSHPRLLWFERT
jgi:hypothetical protein